MTARMVCVTGATGHLGAALVRELLAAGAEVRTLVHRDRRALEGLSVEERPGSVLDPESLRQAFAGADYVVHLAGDVDIRKTLEELEPINVQGTANVLEAAREAGVPRVVHCSSIEAYSKVCNRITESSPLADSETAVSQYGLSKAMADRLVAQAVDQGQDIVTVHPTAVVGPYDFKGTPLGEALVLFARFRILPTISGGFDFVDNRDVAYGILRAAISGRQGAHYILSGRFATVRDLVRTVDRALGRRTVRPHVPSRLLRLAGPATALWNRLAGKDLLDIHSLDILDGFPPIDPAQTRRELGLTPRPLLATVRDTLAWASTQGRF